MERERGFTLIEIVVAVGVTAILMLAGGIWLLGWHPGALRNAADDFDAQLAAARAIAATSGNGATLAFVPATVGPGFVLRVYSGRPTAAGAVKNGNVMALSSTATVSEATFGKPPFAIFLNSGGYPTGTASYPSVASDGTVSFPAIATQPPCPAGHIVLTFINAQGVRATRTLPCNAALSAGTGGSPVPSPTPNAPVVHPPFMLAHWTSDNAPLHFVAAEFGYTHWFASMIGNTCNVQSSDTGAAPVNFASGWPYAQPNSPNELTLAPPVPGAPYSWPNGDPNDPPAPFQLSATPGDGGLCGVRIEDDYGQEADAFVQVMGDLTLLAPSSPAITFASPTAAAQTLTFGQTFDSETLLLQAGATACAGVATVAIPLPPLAQSSPTTTPTTATLSIAPVGVGTCTLLVGDQYGEPTLSLTIAVKNPYTAFDSWPEELELGVGGAAIAITPRTNDDAARAILTLGCYATALMSDGVTPDPVPAAIASFASSVGIYVDATGCFVNASGTPVSGTAAQIDWEPSGTPGNFSLVGSTTCNGSVAGPGTWDGPWTNVILVGLPVTSGTIAGSCAIVTTDGFVTTAVVGHGLTNVVSLASACVSASSPCSILKQREGPGGGGLCTADPSEYYCLNYTTIVSNYDPSTQTWSDEASTTYNICTSSVPGATCPDSAIGFTPTGQSGNFEFFSGVDSKYTNPGEWITGCPPAWIFTQGYSHGTNC